MGAERGNRTHETSRSERALVVMYHPTTTDSNFSNTLAESIKDDPALLDGIARIDLAGVREKRLVAVWKAIARSRPDLVMTFLDSACERGQHHLERITGGQDLGRPAVRRAWIDFVLQRTETADNNIRTLRTGALSLMDYFHRPTMGAMGDTMKPRVWYPDFAKAMGVYSPRAVVDMSNLLLDNMAEEFFANLDGVDERLMTELCEVLVFHGAELDRPIEDPTGVTYPNCVSLLLDRGQKYGYIEDNAMAVVLADLGGNWRTAWDDARLGEQARRVLRHSARVRKALLEESLGGAVRPSHGSTRRL